MNGPYYIVSDNHFMMMHNSSEEERRNRLFQVFDKIKSKGQGTLIIGGDFFDFWFETNNAVPKGYENIIEALDSNHFTCGISKLSIYFTTHLPDRFEFVSILGIELINLQ